MSKQAEFLSAQSISSQSESESSTTESSSSSSLSSSESNSESSAHLEESVVAPGDPNSMNDPEPGLMTEGDPNSTPPSDEQELWWRSRGRIEVRLK
jgi:hypothetical protein